MSRLLYMIPFIGIPIGLYFLITFNMAYAILIAGLALTQIIFCLVYIIWNIFLAGVDGVLEVQVKLWDAFFPVVFLLICAVSFLYSTLTNLTIALTGF
tara:strand:+ start:976 stop:1269 length:294 start_codon:yes stop_codon:yes gene_type:complete